MMKKMKINQKNILRQEMRKECVNHLMKDLVKKSLCLDISKNLKKLLL